MAKNGNLQGRLLDKFERDKVEKYYSIYLFLIRKNIHMNLYIFFIE